MGLRICVSDKFFIGDAPGLGPHAESHSCGVMDLYF